MLRAVYNINWKQHITNKELYGDLPKLSQKIRERTRFAGHAYRSKNEPVAKLIHWTPKHGNRKPGRPPLTYVVVFGLDVMDMGMTMQDRRIWRAVVVRGHQSS